MGGKGGGSHSHSDAFSCSLLPTVSMRKVAEVKPSSEKLRFVLRNFFFYSYSRRERVCVEQELMGGGHTVKCGTTQKKSLFENSFGKCFEHRDAWVHSPSFSLFFLKMCTRKIFIFFV